MPKTSDNPYETWHAARKHEKAKTYPLHYSKDDLVSQCLITDFQPEDVARQISLRDAEAFRQIPKAEFYHYGKNKKACTSIKACSSRFNQTMFWARAEILSSYDCRRRGYMLTFFIKVTKYLYAHLNFQGFAAIVTALSSAPISRLKKSWEHVEKKERGRFEKFDQCLNPESNYSNLRNLLPSTNGHHQAVVPFLGMFLQELEYMESVDQLNSTVKAPDSFSEASPGLSTLNGRSPSDLRKMSDAKLCNIVEVIMGFHRRAFYDFEENLHILNSIKSNTCFEELTKICEQDQYKRSLELEPAYSSSPSGKATCSFPPSLPLNSTMCPLHPPFCNNPAHSHHQHVVISGQAHGADSQGATSRVYRGHRKSKSVGGSLFCGPLSCRHMSKSDSRGSVYGLSTPNASINPLDDPLSLETPTKTIPKASLDSSSGGSSRTSRMSKLLSPIIHSGSKSVSKANGVNLMTSQGPRKSSISDDYLLNSSSPTVDHALHNKNNNAFGTPATSNNNSKAAVTVPKRTAAASLFPSVVSSPQSSPAPPLIGIVNGNVNNIDYASTYFSSEEKEDKSVDDSILNTTMEKLVCNSSPESNPGSPQSKESEKFAGSLRKKLVLNKGKRTRMSYWKKCWVSLSEHGVLSFYPHKALHAPGSKRHTHYTSVPSRKIDLAIDGWYVLRPSNNPRCFLLKSDNLGKVYRLDAGSRVDQWTVEIDSCTNLIKLEGLSLPSHNNNNNNSYSRSGVSARRRSAGDDLDGCVDSEEEEEDDDDKPLSLSPISFASTEEDHLSRHALRSDLQDTQILTRL